MINIAYVYSVFGEEAIQEACLSARSLRLREPNATIILYADRPVEAEYFTECRVLLPRRVDLPPFRINKLRKIDAIADALEGSFERVIYLDADTFIAEALEPFTAVLENFDIATAHDTWRWLGESRFFTPYNAGVIFLRNCTATRDLIRRWGEEYIVTDSIPDQTTFYRVVNASAARLYVLPPELNARCAEPISLSGKVVITHMHYGYGAQHNPASVCALMNQIQFNRLFDKDSLFVTFTDLTFVIQRQTLEVTPELEKIANDWSISTVQCTLGALAT